jgi:hypothetical protein
MADPFMMAAVSIGSTIAGGGISAFGAAQGGKAQAAAYTYQSKVAQLNKQIADNNAAYAVAAGETRAQISGMQARAQIGATRAIQGASGIDVNSGSPVDVRASEADIGGFNALMIRSNAAREAYGYKVKGMEATAQSQLDVAAASQSEKAGELGAIGSILGTAGSVSSRWLAFKNQGIYGGKTDNNDGIYS